MQDFVGSVRRSFVFRSSTSGDDGGGGLGCFVEKFGASIRKSRIGLFTKPPARPGLPPVKKTEAPPIRWRKGELIGCGAFGRVYMGMNLDSGELLAIKEVSYCQLKAQSFCFCSLNFTLIFLYLLLMQVLIAANASKEKTQVKKCFPF